MKRILSLTLLSLAVCNTFGMDNYPEEKVNMKAFLSMYAQYVPNDESEESEKEKLSNHNSEKPKYKKKGYYSTQDKKIDPKKINSVLKNAPKRIQVIINNLKHPLENEDERPDRLLLVGRSGVGKTLLAKAVALKTDRRYYYIKTPYVLDSWKNCHQNLLTELLPLMKKGEKVVVIFDELDQVTNQYKNGNSSDSAVPTAFWLLLDECERFAPHLFIVGTSNNDKFDFPDQVKSRFVSNIVTIPLPNFATRKQIVLYRLGKAIYEVGNLDKLVQDFEGRSCREIDKIMIEAKQNANEGKKVLVIKKEHMDDAIKANPIELSKDARLARQLDVTEEEVRAVREDKHLLESEKTVVDFLLRKKGMEQTEKHHKETLQNSIDQYWHGQIASRRQHRENVAMNQLQTNLTVLQHRHHLVGDVVGLAKNKKMTELEYVARGEELPPAGKLDIITGRVTLTGRVRRFTPTTNVENTTNNR